MAEITQVQEKLRLINEWIAKTEAETAVIDAARVTAEARAQVAAAKLEQTRMPKQIDVRDLEAEIEKLKKETDMLQGYLLEYDLDISEWRESTHTMMENVGARHEKKILVLHQDTEAEKQRAEAAEQTAEDAEHEAELAARRAEAARERTEAAKQRAALLKKVLLGQKTHEYETRQPAKKHRLGE